MPWLPFHKHTVTAKKRKAKEAREAKNMATASKIVDRLVVERMLKYKLTRDEALELIQAESPKLFKSYTLGEDLPKAEQRTTVRKYYR